MSLPEITVYNTLSRKKERLQPLKPGQIGMYACGVTVYDESHIGHAMQAVFFAMIKNYLAHIGYQVTYVRNYTDVDDKIINRAKERGISPLELSAQMIASTQEDMQALGLIAPTHEPKVSENIPAIIAMIETLITNGMAYSTEEGDVYYRVRQKTDYGKLSRQSLDDMRSGSRDIAEREKEDDLDFALWKHDTTLGASWDSPWGKGRPGWHIECSAMAKAILGETFDIHGGGRDLVFPHHENEIAQSEAANQCTFANVWMHSGLLTMNQQKMSKSLGNTITIKEFLKKWHPEVLRLGYLTNHYRSNIDFSEDVFKSVRRRLLYYYSVLSLVERLEESPTGKDPKGYEAKMEELCMEFHTAMQNDFNTPAALAALNKLMRSVNLWLNNQGQRPVCHFRKKVSQTLRTLGGLLFILSEPGETFIHTHEQSVLADLGLKREEIEQAIQQRNQARAAKNWSESDQIRNQLMAQGILLRDGVDTTTWTIDWEDA